MSLTIQQKCPICEGHGNVPCGFYTALPGRPWISSSSLDQCRNCKGEGVVYVKQEGGGE